MIIINACRAWSVVAAEAFTVIKGSRCSTSVVVSGLNFADNLAHLDDGRDRPDGHGCTKKIGRSRDGGMRDRKALSKHDLALT